MIYHVHLLKRSATGSARTIERRTHSAASDLEAIRSVGQNFDISTPAASGFSLRRKDGREIYRWFKTDAERDGAKSGSATAFVLVNRLKDWGADRT